MMVIVSVLAPIATMILIICGSVVVGLLLILTTVISGAVMWGVIRRTLACWWKYLKQVFTLAKALANDPELRATTSGHEKPWWDALVQEFLGNDDKVNLKELT